MTATKTNLVIEQGTTFSQPWLAKVGGVLVDATWTAAAQVRAGYGTPVLHTFAAVVNSDGTVVISCTPAESRLWTWTWGKYDVEITNAAGTAVYRVAEGSVVVSREVTL